MGLPVGALIRLYRYWASETGPESSVAQRWRGRLNARLGRVPARNDKSPAAIAARRALAKRGHPEGQPGYQNRSYRTRTGYAVKG